jgi:microcystin-dependent protein
MSLSQIYTAVTGHTITAARWNNEFGNIYTNGTDVAFPLTKAVSLAGYTLTVDSAGVSTITSPSNTGFLLTVGNKSGAPGANGNLATLTASTFTDTDTAAAGTAALWTGLSVRTPTLAASAANVVTTLAATVYVEGPPTASTNETLTTPCAIYAAGHVVSAKGSDIASASSIAVTHGFHDVTGTTTITAVTKAAAAGTTFRLRFTGAGLNITYNATSMITPWAKDYRTVPNEILEFFSLGSGNYQFVSLNGPPERVGTTIEANSTTTPAGYLPEDGAAVSRTTYAGLFAEVSTTYGVGDGTTTFNVPLSLGLVAINRDPANSVITSASTNGANAATLGGKGGAQTHTLTTAELASHTHTQRGNSNAGDAGGTSGLSFRGATANDGNAGATASAGSDTAHNNTQPWIAKAKYIRF